MTYTNGFHVNLAITKTNRINLEENCFRPDFDNFFKACQPVIDEEGLNPTEFTLISGIYLVNKINMKTHRKYRRYMGYLPERDFHYLDNKLANLDREIRRYITASMLSNEQACKGYAHSRLKIENEKVYATNANL